MAALSGQARRILPNKLVGCTAGIMWVSWGFVTALSDSPASNGIYAAAVFAGPLVVMWMIAPSAIGAGDVKLAIGLAPAMAWPSPQFAFFGLVAAFVLATPQGLMNRKGSVVFGPYLIGGAALGAVGGLIY